MPKATPNTGGSPGGRFSELTSTLHPPCEGNKANPTFSLHPGTPLSSYKPVGTANSRSEVCPSCTGAALTVETRTLPEPARLQLAACYLESCPPPEEQAVGWINCANDEFESRLCLHKGLGKVSGGPKAFGVYLSGGGRWDDGGC